MEQAVYTSDTLTPRELEILRLVATGLSNRDIADELVVVPDTVRWYTKRIYSKLGISGRVQALNRARELGLLADSPAPSAEPVATSQRQPRHNLPSSTTSFIGRVREMTEVKNLLQTVRLLTLTGTGGTGKTRLALQVAADLLTEFPDGVYFIDLVSLTDANLIPQAVAAALNVAESVNQPLMDALKHYLYDQQVLLVLDNFEHLLAGAPLVSDLLASVPGLKILITSREPLHLYGEQEYFVPPLSLPTPATTDYSSELAESEAVSLFIQRARAVKPGFELKPENALAIAKICVRLDGLPLAIELSAARIKLLTPDMLLARLSTGLDALTGGARDLPVRQQTLRNTIEWSYNLLDEGDKILFARLAVFQGGCSLEAIEAVCADGLPIDVLDGLASLVDKGLVQQKEAVNGEPRFYLLEMIREYALDRLDASGEADSLRERHAAYFLELAEHGEPELRLASYDTWCLRFEIELDNMRAVLEWSLENDMVEIGVRIGAALGLLWYGQGLHVEGMRWTQLLLDRLDEAPTPYQPQFLVSAGHMTMLRDLDAARDLYTQALNIARSLADPRQTAWALAFLGYTRQSEPEAAFALVEESLALFRQLDYQPGIAQALNVIGEIARVNGDDNRARQVYEECLAICQQTGEARRICYMYNNLAYIARHEGSYERARDFGRQALRLANLHDYRTDIAQSMITIAGSLGGLGQFENAALLLGAADAVFEDIGALQQAADKIELESIMNDVRGNLDPQTFEAAWQEGRRMSMDEAVRYSLEVEYL